LSRKVSYRLFKNKIIVKQCHLESEQVLALSTLPKQKGQHFQSFSTDRLVKGHLFISNSVSFHATRKSLPNRYNRNMRAIYLFYKLPIWFETLFLLIGI